MGYKNLFFLLVLAFGAIAFADEPGPLPPAHHAPVYQDDDCGTCGNFDPRVNYYCDLNCAPPVLPYPGPVVLQPLPPPVVLPPVYPAPPIYPVYPQPIYPVRPGWGHHPGWGPRPGWGHPGWGPRPGWGPHPGPGPRPMPHYHRMSAAGCEIQQNNNGEFVLMSNSDQVLFSDSSAHAEENAKAMKAYYEKSNLGLCSVPAIESTQSTDI